MDITLLSSKYKVRRIKDSDIKMVLSLCKANNIYYKHCPPAPTKESIKNDLKALPPNKDYTDKYYIGFFDKEKLIAVMDLILKYPDDNTAYIGFFMVEKEIQKKGVGSFIISECFKYLEFINFKKIKLGYVKENNQAKSFWAKNGFIDTGFYVKQELYTVVALEKEL